MMNNEKCLLKAEQGSVLCKMFAQSRRRDEGENFCAENTRTEITSTKSCRMIKTTSWLKVTPGFYSKKDTMAHTYIQAGGH